MCRIDLCGQIGVKIGVYGDRIFLKFNPLNCPMGQFIPREDIYLYPRCIFVKMSKCVRVCGAIHMLLQLKQPNVIISCAIK